MERREFILQAIADRERRKAEGVSLQAQETIDREIQAFQAELEQIDEALVAEQIRTSQQKEHIDGLTESTFALGLFEAIEAKPDEGERLHEYEERRREFYFIVADFVKEQVATVIELYNAEMAEKEEKIRALTKQGIETENQLAAVRSELAHDKADLAQITEAYETKVEEYKSIHAILIEKDEQLRMVLAENDVLTQKIGELESKIEQAKPKEYVAPSQNITERVANLKAKSTLSADELIKRFEDRLINGGKVRIEPPSIGEPPGNSFRAEDHPADSGAVEESIQDEAPITFQNETESVQGIQQGNEQEASTGEGQAVGTLAEAFERIGQLERAVYGKPAQEGQVA